MKKQALNVGIGFATGRKHFRKVLNSYIYNWEESGIGRDSRVKLSLFAAYDLNYSGTQSTDYTNLSQEVADAFEDTVFLGEKSVRRNVERLVTAGMLSREDARLIFAPGYAGKRNAILYAALESGMDCILFLDDDEYPVAVTNSRGSCLWGGQHLIPKHLEYIGNADITNGYHCGYISPIPNIQFGPALGEDDFRRFIGALSNDVVNWDSIRRIMEDGGVTYADTSVLLSEKPEEVKEENGCKFITGANLCINLSRPERVLPFYNPPGARGEDTFLSCLLGERVVKRIPCYAFHDGFGIYKHLLDGVLPTQLAAITEKSGAIVKRFYDTCIGWVRYKPLLLYITRRDEYRQSIDEIRGTLKDVTPKICQYFEDEAFMNILTELDRYDKNVLRHFRQFVAVQDAWDRLIKKRTEG